MSVFLNKDSLHIIKRLWKEYIRKHMRLIWGAIGLLIILAAATAVQPILLQQTFDKVFRDKDLDYLTFLPIAIIGICLVQAVASYFSALLLNKFSNGIIADMRKALFEHIINNEITFYSAYDSGNLLARVTGEIISIAAGIQMFFNMWARQLITSLGLLAVMLYQSVELSVIALSALAVAFYPITKITKRLKKLSYQSQSQYGLFQSRMLETFQGIRVIKSFAKENFEIRKINQYISELERLTNKTVGVSGLTPVLMQLLAGVAIAFVIWYGGWQLIHDKMTAGNLIAFITSLLMIARPVRSMTSAGGSMTSGLVNAERFYSIIDTKPKYASRHEGNTLAITQGHIVLDHVSFAYPNGTVALDNVSFTAAGGKKTALVGHSGSGKSTIFNLLLKFYDADQGRISLDGQDIQTASIDSLRNQVALVSQDTFIFDDTAKNNIGYGREGATDEEIIAAAKAARCHDFIMALPQGYDTTLGFFGQNLSGGQKQRISIARAFLRNAPILLLDEATSSLDPKTEAEIQEALESLTKGRTTIIIAHRLSTVMRADHMVLLKKGEVVATGRHEELLATSAEYKDLFGI